MLDWYGARVAEQYGETPPQDWREAVDRSDNDTILRGLAVIRSKYTAHPPTFPQFEEAMAPLKHHNAPSPSVQSCLAKFAVERYAKRLSPKQLRGPWTYLGAGFDAVGTITGLVIPPDGDLPGYRITVEDMNAPDFQAPV